MRRIFLLVCAVFLGSAIWLPAAIAATAPSQVTDVRWYNSTDAVTGAAQLRIVLDLTGPVNASARYTPGSSPLLTVDIPNMRIGNGVASKFSLGGSSVSAATLTQSGSSCRMVLQMNLPSSQTVYKVFSLRKDAANNKPDRLVIDIKEKPEPIKFNFTPGLSGKRIAIDPGHGGSDPGAIGSAGIKEKDITFAVAMKLRALLQQAGANVIMTRTADKDVFGPFADAGDELGARSGIANRNKADIFLSIHINSFTSPKVGGTSVYYYEKSGYDSMLAQNIQDNLVQAVGLQDRGIHQANFYVLKTAAMPAALAELAFISNPSEEKLISTDAFQTKAAQGIFNGMNDFFKEAAAGGGQ